MKQKKNLFRILLFIGFLAQGLPALGQYQIGYKADLKQGETVPLESLFPYEKGKGSLLNIHGGFPVYIKLPKGSQNIWIADPDILDKRGDSLVIKKPGSARLEVDRGAYLLYISLRAELLYGSAEEVATGTAPVAPKKILIREDQDLDKHIGVGAHMFVASWWSVITPSGEEKTFSDNEGVFSIPVRDLLALGNDFKLEVFDGCDSYDPHTGESYGDSKLNFEIIDQRTPTHYTITLSANPSQGGSVSGAGMFEEKTEVTVVAQANSEYEFVKWTENGAEVSTSASYQFQIKNDRNLVALFKQIPPTQYTVSLSAQPAEGGSIQGAGKFDKGSEVTVRATPASGWRFVKWTERELQVSTSASYTFTITGNRNLVAVFEQIPVTTYSVSLSAQPAEGGTVSGNGTYDENSSVRVTATPASGWRFVNWTENGAQVSDQASFTFQITSDSKLVAVFEKIPLALPKNFKLEKTYQRDVLISWEAGSNEVEWELSYGEEKLTVKESKATLRGLNPNTEYTITIRAKVEGQLSEPLVEKLTTESFTAMHHLIPHLYGMKESFATGEVLDIFWKDLKTLPTSCTYNLSKQTTSTENPVLIFSPLPESIQFGERGQYVLTIKIGDNEVEEIKYFLEVK